MLSEPSYAVSSGADGAPKLSAHWRCRFGFAPPPSLRWLPTDRSLPTECERPRGVPGRERALAEPMHRRSADKRSQVSIFVSSGNVFLQYEQLGKVQPMSFMSRAAHLPASKGSVLKSSTTPKDLISPPDMRSFLCSISA